VRCRFCLRRATDWLSARHLGSLSELARQLTGVLCQYAVRQRARARGGSGEFWRGVQRQPQREQTYLPATAA